jgi:tRNA(Ile)-lysidine synthase
LSSEGCTDEAEATWSRVLAAMVDALEGPCGAPDGTPLVAACSGGGDSVALVALLGRLAQRWPLEAVVFIDHGLRDVAAERRSAQAAAARAGAPFREAKVVLPARGNRQAAARQARYEALRQASSATALVATAHTLSDQAETVLQRLVRGAGLRGLAAIRPRDGAVVRPLLAISRDELRALGLPHADDPTNATEAYQRNRLRHRVMPALREENPSVEAALARVASQAQHELALLDALLARLGPSDADLRGASPELAATWVRWRLGREFPDAAVSREAADALAERLVAGVASGAVSLADGVRGIAQNGRMRLESADDPRKVLVAPSPGTYRRSSWVVEVAAHPVQPRDPRAGAPPSTLEPTDRTTLWLDARSLVWPLRFELPRAGVELEPSHVTDALGRPLTSVSPPLAAAPVADQPALRVVMRRQFVNESTERVL